MLHLVPYHECKLSFQVVPPDLKQVLQHSCSRGKSKEALKISIEIRNTEKKQNIQKVSVIRYYGKHLSVLQHSSSGGKSKQA